MNIGKKRMKHLPLNTNIRTGFTWGNLVGWLSLKTNTECIDTRHIKILHQKRQYGTDLLNLLQPFHANTLAFGNVFLVDSEKSTGNTS